MQTQKTLRELFPEVEKMATLMRLEMYANMNKGNHWLTVSPNNLLQDVMAHWVKLTRALANLESGIPDSEDDVREYAADVANMSMLLLDRLGLL